MVEARIHQGGPVLATGLPLAEAKKAIILIHGRGANAQSILPLGRELGVDEAAVLAPQASGNTWYPYRFIEPIERNEPHLSSALATVGELVAHVEASGIEAENIIVGGFSQGACLAAEFVARSARRYGGLLIFSGGLIGQQLDASRYSGSLAGTPVFIGCDAEDFHIPVTRVHETTAQLAAMGANVTERIYQGMGHTISDEELAEARTVLAG